MHHRIQPHTPFRVRVHHKTAVNPSAGAFKTPVNLLKHTSAVMLLNIQFHTRFCIALPESGHHPSPAEQCIRNLTRHYSPHIIAVHPVLPLLHLPEPFSRNEYPVCGKGISQEHIAWRKPHLPHAFLQLLRYSQFKNKVNHTVPLGHVPETGLNHYLFQLFHCNHLPALLIHHRIHYYLVSLKVIYLNYLGLFLQCIIYRSRIDIIKASHRHSSSYATIPYQCQLLSSRTPGNHQQGRNQQQYNRHTPYQGSPSVAAGQQPGQRAPTSSVLRPLHTTTPLRFEPLYWTAPGILPSFFQSPYRIWGRHILYRRCIPPAHPVPH